jgi:hypothetical protein
MLNFSRERILARQGGFMHSIDAHDLMCEVGAAAVSGGDAIKTGFVAFFYSLRTIALPFVFIFNTDLLLIDVSFTHGVLIFVISSIAIIAFTAGTMGWFVTKSRFYESIALILISFVLFRPDFVMDRIQPPFATVESAQFEDALSNAKPGDELRLVVSGPDFDTSEIKDTTLVVSIKEEKSGAERLAATGLILLEEEGIVKMDEPGFSSPFVKNLEGFDFYGDKPVELKSVQASASQLPKEIIFIPALLLLVGVGLLQRRRAEKIAPVTAANTEAIT